MWRVTTITGTVRHIRADDLANAQGSGRADVQTCDEQGVREDVLHPRRPAFYHRVRLANVVQVEAVAAPPIQAEPVQAQAVPTATAKGLVLDAQEDEESLSL